MTYRYGGCWNNRDASDDSFCCNGFIAANRKYHPSAYEVKHQYQNVWALPLDVAAGRIYVLNENFFKCLKNVRLVWSLSANGKAVKSGIVEDLKVAPQKKVELQLGYTADDVKALTGEVLLTVKFVLKGGEPLLAAGYEIAHNQYVVTPYDVAGAFNAALPKGVAKGAPCALKIDGRKISGDSFTALFDEKGYLASYIYKGTELLSKPMKPQFYRALTENDYGVRKNAKFRANYDGWLVWRNDVATLQKFAAEEMADKCVKIEAVYNYTDTGATVTMTYVIDLDGTIAVTENMKAVVAYRDNVANFKKAPNLLRYGMELAMPAAFDTIEFYGAGEHETYIDRKSSAVVGVYKQGVDEQFWPYYARPQECGAHCDLRWWRITDTAGRGFEVVSDVLFQANALPYPMEQIDVHSKSYRKYSQRLEKDGNTYVNIDKAQMGLGCVTSWRNLPRLEYQIPHDNREFKFVLRPLK